MRTKAFIFGLTFFALMMTGYALHAQEVAAPAATSSDPEALSIIKLAESKLYTPLDKGLTDFTVTHQVAFKERIQTLWYKSPDKVAGILGYPSEEKKVVDVFAEKEPIYVRYPVPEVVAWRELGWVLGKPISILLPFGTFQVLSKDETGTKLRYTAYDTDPMKPPFWTHIDFHLDQDFHLIKIVEMTHKQYGGQIDEHKYTLKPCMEGSDLMIVDTSTTLAGTQSWQQGMKSTYNYKEQAPYLLLDSIDMELMGKDKTIHEKFMNYKINEGIDDALFEKNQEG